MSFEKKREGRRDSWVKECAAPTSYQGVSKLMADFENKMGKRSGTLEKRHAPWVKEAVGI